MEKEKYIQLPPIPEDMDGNTVRLIWEYAKLPKKEKQAIYDQYKVLSDDSRTTNEVETIVVKPDDSEKIEEFGKNMQAVIAELFREAAGLAQYVYEECFVKGKDIDSLLTDNDRMSEALFGMYMLFLEDREVNPGYMS